MPRRAVRLTTITQEALLDLELRELPISLSRTPVGKCVQRLYQELEQRGIVFRPYVWFSDEWFSPDGAPGIAIPFYLGHPRLIKLEEKFMLHAEGAGELECMKILRHEAGHALDTAYQLHRRKSWRELFGSFAEPYPKSYRPRPKSRDYVFHLNDWYSQAHPAEDFAETFAVWLTPGSKWRQQYRDFGALRKLEYVDQLMQEIAGQKPKVSRRIAFDELRTIKRTLRKHYELRQRRYAPQWPRSLDKDLRRIFSTSSAHQKRESGAALLRRYRVSLRTLVSDGTGVAPYTVDQLIDDAIERCKHLKLRKLHSTATTQQLLAVMLASQMTKLVHAGKYEIVL